MMAARRHPTGDMTDRDAPGEQPADAREVHRLTLRFDDHGWSSLEAAADRDGQTLDELLTRAASYFEGELPPTRVAMSAPLFKPPDHGSPREVGLALPAPRWQRLSDEAGRQGIPIEQLLEHAALLYLADADAGLVADRVLERADEATRRPQRPAVTGPASCSISEAFSAARPRW